ALVGRFAHPNRVVIALVKPKHIDGVIGPDGHERGRYRDVSFVSLGRLDGHAATGSPGEPVVGGSREKDAFGARFGCYVPPAQVDIAIAGAGVVVHGDPRLVSKIDTFHKFWRAIYGEREGLAVVRRTVDKDALPRVLNVRVVAIGGEENGARHAAARQHWIGCGPVGWAIR